MTLLPWENAFHCGIPSWATLGSLPGAAVAANSSVSGSETPLENPAWAPLPSGRERAGHAALHREYCDFCSGESRSRCLKEIRVSDHAKFLLHDMQLLAALLCRKRASSLPACQSLGLLLCGRENTRFILRELRMQGEIPFPTALQEGVQKSWTKSVRVLVSPLVRERSCLAPPWKVLRGLLKYPQPHPPQTQT